MNNKNILILLDKAIEAGKKESFELNEIFNELDLILETEGKQSILRYFFDCWTDAINHNFMVYDTRDPKEWIDASIELRNWFLDSKATLSKRELWKEALPNNL